MANKTEKMTADNAKQLVEDTLKKDYNMTGKTVTLDTSNSYKFKAMDPSHYVLTIIFTVA